MAINSRAKGCRGERELAKFLKDRGYVARRGQQFTGGGDSPDVVHNIPGVHLEAKRVEKGQLYEWLAQAERDAKKGNRPIVAHRRNNKRWVAVMYLDDLLNLLCLTALP